jgi:hypothetical protein
VMAIDHARRGSRSLCRGSAGWQQGTRTQSGQSLEDVTTPG